MFVPFPIWGTRRQPAAFWTWERYRLGFLNLQSQLIVQLFADSKVGIYFGHKPLKEKRFLHTLVVLTDVSSLLTECPFGLTLR